MDPSGTPVGRQRDPLTSSRGELAARAAAGEAGAGADECCVVVVVRVGGAGCLVVAVRLLWTSRVIITDITPPLKL